MLGRFYLWPHRLRCRAWPNEVIEGKIERGVDKFYTLMLELSDGDGEAQTATIRYFLKFSPITVKKYFEGLGGDYQIVYLTLTTEERNARTRRDKDR